MKKYYIDIGRFPCESGRATPERPHDSILTPEQCVVLLNEKDSRIAELENENELLSDGLLDCYEQIEKLKQRVRNYKEYNEQLEEAMLRLANSQALQGAE